MEFFKGLLTIKDTDRTNYRRRELLNTILLVSIALVIVINIAALMLIAYRKSFIASNDGMILFFISSCIVCFDVSVFFLLALVSWIGSKSLDRALERLAESNRMLEAELAGKSAKDTALAENRRRAEAILQHTLNSVFLVNDREIIEDTNPAATRLTGYGKSELVGVPIWNLFEGLSDKFVHRFKARLLTYGRSRGTVRIKHKSGRIIHTEFIAVMSVLPALHLTVFWDISDRIRTNKALRDSRELLRKTFDSIKAAILIVDAKSDTVIEANDASTEIFGYEKDELIGRTTEMLHINPASFETFRANLDAASGRKGYLADFQFRMKRKNGAVFPTEHTMSPIVNDSGETTGWVSVIRDISERKRLEEQLFHSQKMEALGRLAGGITHDFNNLLTTIFGYCEIGKMNADADTGTSECFTEIKKAAERAATLTGQLLAFSRKQILSPRRIDLNELILNMKRLLARLVVENVTVEYALADKTDPIKADPVQIEQIIVNLIVNACDAMPGGGSVIVETRNCRLDESFTELQPDIEPGNYVMIGISDNGCGMDERTLKQIFDPFFAPVGQGRGAGMNLAMVFGIVKQSSGYIHVVSEPGKGTKFDIYFPREESADRDDARISSAKRISLFGNERILLIEDDESLRRIVEKTLVKYGYRVEEARTGNDALSIALQSGKRCFDLVITDMIMPGMSGKEVAERLGSEFPGLKVIFISGYTDNVTVNHGIEHNEKAFLQKPFSPDDIVRKVREVLDAG